MDDPLENPDIPFDYLMLTDAEYAERPTAPQSAVKWSAPVPLAQSPDVPPFPVDVLPGWLAAFVTAQAVELQVPVDLPALLSLGAAAGGIARKVVVTPRPGWDREPTNLFTMVSLPPGERKSQAFAKVLAPVADLERNLREQALPTVKEAESEFRIRQKRVEYLEAKIAKEEDAADREKLITELKQARDELQQMEVPALPVLRVDDDTPEMIALELVKQGGRLMAASPEARTLENITRYSDTPNADVFLKGHAGDDLRSGRISRGRDSVDRAALTCVFSPQPCVLEGLAESPELLGRGFFARWFYSLPISRVGFRQVAPPPPAVPATIRAAYISMMTRLWLTEYAGGDNETEPHELRFTAAAESELNSFLEWVEEVLRPGGSLRALGGWGNKLGGLCVRLCGILHAADGIPTGNGWMFTPIDVGVVRRAVRLCREYAVPHALAVFDLMGASETIVNARGVLKWVKGRPVPTAAFTKRDAFNGCRGRFDTVKEMEPALELLEQHYLIGPKDQHNRPGPGRKPSPVYEVNPAAFESETPEHIPHNAHNSSPMAAVGHSAESADSARESSPELGDDVERY